MKQEAALLLPYLKQCKKVSKRHYSFLCGNLHIVGTPGEKSLISCLDQLEFNQDQQVILFGTAGALDQNLKIGEIFSVSSVLKLEPNKFEKRNLTVLDKLVPVSTTALTAKQPVVKKKDRLKCFAETKARIVDMEGFYFAEYLAKHGVESVMTRIVSDTSEVPFQIPFAQEIKESAKLFAKKLLNC
jgi:nucleoside phosphorylase